jgi:hypothetical protein
MRLESRGHLASVRYDRQLSFFDGPEIRSIVLRIEYGEDVSSPHLFRLCCHLSADYHGGVR